MRFVRYEPMDERDKNAFINASDPSRLKFAFVSPSADNELGNPREIAVIKASREVPESWHSVYKGVRGGRWMEIAVVEDFATAQTLLNTMSCGKIKHGDEEIVTKNPQLNDN